LDGISKKKQILIKPPAYGSTYYFLQ